MPCLFFEKWGQVLHYHISNQLSYKQNRACQKRSGIVGEDFVYCQAVCRLLLSLSPT
ncbi:hypothetical protein D3OALGB2SA_1441 [Olavius algarvensis associated proteobacterium Delta 3]|nr:hypothetical protein D3OALGB2SA_1441 [Olavius algarvensis associated proteobacterium Delta 3]